MYLELFGVLWGTACMISALSSYWILRPLFRKEQESIQQISCASSPHFSDICHKYLRLEYLYHQGKLSLEEWNSMSKDLETQYVQLKQDNVENTTRSLYHSLGNLPEPDIFER